MKKTLFKESKQEKTWCAVNIELENGKLSITGNYGRIVTRAQAKREAWQCWESLFGYDTDEMAHMRKEFKKLTPKSAAKLVCDDVYKEENNKVYVLEGWGKCFVEINKWFPEISHIMTYQWLEEELPQDTINFIEKL